MRHRQNSGAGTSGGRPSIVAFTFLCGSAIPAVLISEPGGPWIAYGVAAFSAGIGVCALWARRGLMERRIEEMAGRRRSDLALAGEAQQRHRAEIERMCAELENEQQYTTVLQDQLIRLRTVVEHERQLRLAAERQADTAARALAGAGRLPVRPEPMAAPQPFVEPEPVARRQAPQTATPAAADLPPVAPAQAPPTQAVSPQAAPARDADMDRDFSDELLYRPFIEMAAVESPLSPAALAMAPVLGLDTGTGAEEDDVLDLIAYDQTVEFSVRALRGDKSA
jgi:hypothetical protein